MRKNKAHAANTSFASGGQSMENNAFMPRSTTIHESIKFDIVQSLIAMFAAWFIGYIFFAVYMVHFSSWGHVTDFSFVFFITGFFATISAVTIVPLAIFLLHKVPFKKRKMLFPIATILFSQAALTIFLLVFTNFQSLSIGVFYYLYAGIIGLAFGLIYLWFQKINFIGKDHHIIKKIAVLISPVLFLLFLFYLLPYTSPGLAYRYFGDSIKDKAIKYILLKYKIGDKSSILNRELPGFIADDNINGSIQSYGGNYSYEIEYENGIITKLKIDESQ